MSLILPRACTTVAAAASLVLGGCAASLNAPPPVDMPATPPLTAAQLQPPAPSSANPTGGLFNANRYRPVFENRRARLVGDMVTVTITEQVTASQKSSSTMDRDSSMTASVSALPGLKSGASVLGKLGVGTASKNEFEGGGGTSSANAFTGSITTNVVEVLPNGHLVIAGEKQIGVNHNVDVLRFTGTVDPHYLRPGSIIPSIQVANVRVESRSRGQAGEAQSIGWLSRFFLNVIPF